MSSLRSFSISSINEGLAMSFEDLLNGTLELFMFNAGTFELGWHDRYT